MTYNNAALMGFGLRKKGKPSLTRLVYYTRQMNKHLKKLSRCSGKRKMKGGAFNPLSLIPKSLTYWFKYGKSWHKDKEDQEKELARLRAKKGGKFELADLRDVFIGPAGWVRLGMRKKRQREIDKLKQELGE